MASQEGGDGDGGGGDPVRLAGYGYDQLEDWVRATLSAALLPDG